MHVDHDPNHRPGPRPELLSAEGLAFMQRDPDAFMDAQRVLVEETQGWDKATVERKIAKAAQREIVAEMLERFTLVSELEGPQRKREVEDLKFDRALLEDQWDAKDLEARKALNYPCLVVSRLDQPVQQVINEANDSRIAVVVKPRGKTANKDGAEVRQGLYRAIEVDSNADDARTWALERTVKCGRGAWRIVKVFRNDGDFDLDIGIDRILNQGAVYFDPWATKPDWSDGEWCIIIEDLPLKTYKRMYPDSDILASAGDPLTSEGNVPPDWLPGDSVRIAEYFRVVHTPRVLLMDPETRQNKLLPVGMKAPDGAKSRVVQKRTVEWYVCNGVEVLDTEKWEGRYIPVVPTIGKEYNIDGKERVFKGMISNSKDSQRMFNYFKSLQVQAARLTTQETYLADPRSIENFGKSEAWKGIKILPFRAELNGVLIPPPEKMFKEPELQSITLALHEVADDIRATTGRQSASLGEYGPERSGKAVRELKQQGENTTSNYLRNYVRALGYEARVVLDLMPYVYDGERIVRLLGEEPDDERSVMLNGDFYETPDGPIPVNEMQEPGFFERAKGMLTGRNKQPLEKKRYDIRPDEDYAYVVSVGRSYQTQKEEDAAVFEAIIKANPAMAEIIGPLWVESLEGPAAARAAEILKKLNPALRKAEDGEPEIPPEVQQQLQQSQQMIEQLTAALQEKTQEQAVDAQKLEMQRAIKEMEIQADTALKQQEMASKVALEQASADREIALATLKAEQERRKQEDQQAHERLMQAEKIAAETASRERIETLKIAAERETVRLKMDAERESAQLKIGADRESTRLKLDADREMSERTAQTQKEIAERKQTMTVKRNEQGYIQEIER